MDAATTTDTRITVKLRRDLHKRLKFKAVAEDKEFPELLDEAVDVFLAGRYMEVLQRQDAEDVESR